MSLRNLERHARDLRERAERLEVPQNLADQFGPYWNRPVAFVQELLDAEPEPYQEEVLQAAAEEGRIAWRAAHGVGKTATLSWLLLWWLLSRPFSRVLVAAPAFERQVGRYLLPEVRRWVRRAPEPLPVEVRANTVEVEGFGREWFALGVQASDPAKIEGAHADSVAVLADEAKGLPADVVAALHGSMTDAGGDRLYVLASVPGGSSGAFYDAFRSGVWTTFATSAHESELVAESWIEERMEEWGEGSPLYVTRVEGEFPDEDEGTLFRLSDLEAAVERTREPPEEGEPEPAVTLGVDPARFGGDRSALAVWRGCELERVEARQGLDTMEVAAWVASEINRREPAAVRVDEIGIGAGVVDRLRQMGHHVEAVNVGSRADRPELHANVRAAIFWRLREALERGDVVLADDEKLLAELSALRYGFTSRGMIQLEAKDKTRKRVGRSPDLADAVALGFTGARRQIDPKGRDALTLGGYTVEEARDAGLLEDDGEWHSGSIDMPASPRYR